MDLIEAHGFLWLRMLASRWCRLEEKEMPFLRRKGGLQFAGTRGFRSSRKNFTHFFRHLCQAIPKNRVERKNFLGGTGGTGPPEHRAEGKLELLKPFMRSLIYRPSVGSSANSALISNLLAKLMNLPGPLTLFFQRRPPGLIHPCAVVLPPAERNAARPRAHSIEAGAAAQASLPASTWRACCSNLAAYKLGRIMLHLLCCVRTGHLLWHWHGILREFHS